MNYNRINKILKFIVILCIFALIGLISYKCGYKIGYDLGIGIYDYITPRE